MNRLLAALGTAAAVVGIAAFVRPSLVSGVSLPDLLVGLLGLLGLLGALWLGYGRLTQSDGAPTLPTPEDRQVASVPGAAFDERLATTTVRGRVGGTYDRDELRDRLHRTAVAVLTRREGLTAPEARDRLADGTWTDDRVAAAFFAPIDVVRPSLADRVRLTITSDVAFRWQARRVVADLHTRMEGRDR